MKKYKSIYIILLAGLIVLTCKQETITLKEQVVVPPPPDTPVKGQLDMGKFVAIGSSYTAGFQAGALFDDGQNNSLPAILNRQFELIGAPEEFKQPTINSPLGYNIFVTPNPDEDQHIFGRFLLQYNGEPDPLPTPQLSALGALPDPSHNAGFIYGNGDSKAALNNFGIQAIVIGQALIPETGKWSGAGVDPRFNPFYGRLAYPGNGTSTLLTDALGAGGTFFFFWLGMDDFMLNAAYGGDGSKAPLTDVGAFGVQFDMAMDAFLANTELEGVVANFPDIFMMPHFTSVPYNPIPLDQFTADLVNSNYAGYNQILNALKGPPFNYPAASVDSRKISFVEGDNPFVMIDEYVNDYGDEFDILLGAGAIDEDQRAALEPLRQVRQTTPADIIPFAAATVLGTLADSGNPLSIMGVAVPMEDRYVLTPDESSAINEARFAFNQKIADKVSDHADQLALADMNAALTTLITNQGAMMNNVFITPNIDPPSGIYSEDGLHPNTRGYAFLSTVVIKAINAKTTWGAHVPLTDLSLYPATGLPIP